MNELLVYNVSFDWLSFTTDILDIELNKNGSFLKQFEYYITRDYKKTLYNFLINFDFFKNIIKILKIDKDEIGLSSSVINGYKYSITFGENIKLFILNPNARNNENLYISQLLFNGRACREFIQEKQGNFYELLNYLKDIGKFKRLDIAIDDFLGKDFNIYNIPDLLKKKEYISKFKSYNLNIGVDNNENKSNKSFMISFGTRKTNSLVIYDKYLERLQANDLYINTDLWYRYELRLLDTSNSNTATLFVLEYLKLMKENNSKETFLKLAKSTLKSYIDFKVPSFDSNKSRWESRKDWGLFLENVEKATFLELEQNDNIKLFTTIEKRIEYIEKSLSKIIAELYITNNFNRLYEIVLKGIDSFDSTNISRINNYFKEKGLQPIDNNYIKKSQFDLKEIIEKRNK